MSSGPEKRGSFRPTAANIVNAWFSNPEDNLNRKRSGTRVHQSGKQGSIKPGLSALYPKLYEPISATKSPVIDRKRGIAGWASQSLKAADMAAQAGLPDLAAKHRAAARTLLSLKPDDFESGKVPYVDGQPVSIRPRAPFGKGIDHVNNPGMSPLAANVELYRSQWPSKSLEEDTARLLGPNYTSWINHKSGKLIFENPVNGQQTVIDTNAHYFRNAKPDKIGTIRKSDYLDAAGIKTWNFPVVGHLPQPQLDEYLRNSHFNIKPKRKP